MIEPQSSAEQVARVAGVRARLDFASRAPLTRDVDWGKVQQAVDDAFAQLARDVAIRQPEARSQPGANSSRAVVLYAYRIFDLAIGDDAEPVVVGVSFKRVENGIVVRGDICGEDSGRILLAPLACRAQVPEHPDRVLRRGSEVASRLAREVDALVEILKRGEAA